MQTIYVWVNENERKIYVDYIANPRYTKTKIIKFYCFLFFNLISLQFLYLKILWTILESFSSSRRILQIYFVCLFLFILDFNHDRTGAR